MVQTEGPFGAQSGPLRETLGNKCARETRDLSYIFILIRNSSDHTEYHTFWDTFPEGLGPGSGGSRATLGDLAEHHLSSTYP